MLERGNEGFEQKFTSLSTLIANYEDKSPNIKNSQKLEMATQKVQSEIDKILASQKPNEKVTKEDKIEMSFLNELLVQTKTLENLEIQKEKNQQIIDQMAKLGEIALNSEKSKNAVTFSSQNYNEEIGGGSQTAKNLRQNGFRTFRESGKYKLKYDYNLQNSEEIDQKLNLVNPDVENSTENATTPPTTNSSIENSTIEPTNELTNEPVLQILPAIDETPKSEVPQTEPQEALPDPSLEIQTGGIQTLEQMKNLIIKGGFMEFDIQASQDLAAKEETYQDLINLQKESYSFTSKKEIINVLSVLFSQNENSQIAYGSQNATVEKLKIAQKSLLQILKVRDVPFNYKQNMIKMIDNLQIQTAKVEQNQKLIKEMESWAESEFDKVENTNMLNFGEEKRWKTRNYWWKWQKYN